jgi:hypothetical protein
VQEVGRGGYGHREVVVRVTGLATPWGRDDVAAVRAPPAQRRAGTLSALSLRIIAVQRPLHTSVSLLRDEISAPLHLKRDCDRAPGGLQRGRRGAAAESGERGAGAMHSCVRRRSTRTLSRMSTSVHVVILHISIANMHVGVGMTAPPAARPCGSGRRAPAAPGRARRARQHGRLVHGRDGARGAERGGGLPRGRAAPSRRAQRGRGPLHGLRRPGHGAPRAAGPGPAQLRHEHPALPALNMECCAAY